MRWLIVAAAGCGSSGGFGDLDLVAIAPPDGELESARADVDQIVLSACEPELVIVEVGRTVDLLLPEPLPLPSGTWCTAGLQLAEYDGGLEIEGELDGEPFSLSLDPGLAARDVSLTVEEGSEIVLALDVDLLLDDDRDEVLELGDITADDALGERLADRVDDALVFFESPEEGEAVYVDLWPNLDWSFSADIRTGGCGGQGGVQRSPGVAFPDEDGDGDGGGGAGGDDDDGGGGGGDDDDDVEVVEIDAGTVPAPSSGGCDGDGCSSTRRTGGCSGCDGGGGCAADGGGASCDCQGQACATLPVGPGAVGLTILVFLRRRPTRGSR